MTVAMKKQLDESLRDAQLAFYLHKIAPGKSLPGTVRLKTARDLYEYWLLDVLVSQDVPTTPVACAIASLQQYINRILMNMEPGYDQANITPEQMQTWRNEMHQYPVWAAHQKLLYFPASYLDPVLRNNKSDNFQQLENELNQNRIQTDAVQSAVMAYLTRFEEIANLNILNGYIDGEDFANSNYYFIAKSRTENTYFWRSLNMTQRPLNGTPAQPPAIAHKLDQPDPYAWSDWEKADVPIPDSAVEHSIRPVWFNNRLFVVWAECIHQDPSASSAPSSAGAMAPRVNHPLLRLSYCFKKQDGIWSTPRVALQGYCDDDAVRVKDQTAIQQSICTVAVQHRVSSQALLYLAISVRRSTIDSAPASSSPYSFIKTIYIDKNLALASASVTSIKQSQTQRPALDLDYTFIEPGRQNIQTCMSLLNIERNATPSPKNISHQLSVLDEHLNGDIFKPIDAAPKLLINADDEAFPLAVGDIHFTFSDYLEFVLPSLGESSPSSYIKLSAGSILHAKCVINESCTLQIGELSDVIRDDEKTPGFSTNSVVASGSRSLAGKFISMPAVRYLIKLYKNRPLHTSNTAAGQIHISFEYPNSYNVEGPTEFTCKIDELHRKYIIMRHPISLEANSLTYDKLTLVTESDLKEALPSQFDYPLRIEDVNWNCETLFYGVALARPSEPEKTIYFALKEIRLTLVPQRFAPPKIAALSTPDLGTTQFIDFATSDIRNSDSKSQKRQPIRLNTVFAPELIQRTENSLDELFDTTTQHLAEPAIADDIVNRMDFHGSYGRYFTELFLYLPWLVAHRLNVEQRYDEAERWLRRVFDPSRGKEDCWRALPLIDSSTPSYADQAPHDPHQIALSHPAHFRKALYFLYLDILINRGDAAYRELTPDGLSEAKLWYVRVLDLLGPRPTVQSVDHWASISLQTLSEASSEKLREFERSVPHSQASSPVREGASHASLPTIDSPHLRLPFHPQLLQCWDIAESRLHNLRHNLDIAGKPLHLPIFAAPLDPRVLLSSGVLNTSDNTVRGGPPTAIPHYRFSLMHQQALSAVESLNQFGAVLLSLIERKEQAQLQELQQQQAWNLAKISVDLQRQALNIDRQNRQALLASQAIAQNRVTHYKKLLDDSLSGKEMAVSGLSISSGSFEAAALAFQVAAGGLMLAPNIAGLSFGGSRWEGPALAASAAAHSAAIINRTIAADLDRQAIFDRRREDWQHTHDQSQLELAQIDAQLAQFTEQETATRLQLRQAESTLSQTKTNYDFLSKRFTRAQLYQWLNSQFAALYRQAYDTTLSLCLAAEQCWQYEIGDLDARFIQPGAWNTTYRGLGAGEQLKLSLLNMQAEYLRRNQRELEIRKTISLRQLKDQTKTKTINKPWLEMHAELKKGQCEFELSQELFESDYKEQKHYLRRIKTISVSLPTVVGPYENIRAILTQTSSKVFTSANDTGRLMEGRRANQQIALSTGVDDNGLFTLNFNDERYLPFEYTGAVSQWQLTFPNPEAQKDLLDSLTDVIVHVSYTARVGGGVS
ncbi:Tc toxin subunit A-related protein [Pseudomonas sp. Z3-6]|uniref:Tc toxin subunit A-related protein n=1 Tax=Pseudomonas sp. Z3-6 TaxID=2817411 RepID=UPI003DA8C8CF